MNFRISILLMALAILAFSCKKEKDGDDGNCSNSGSFSFTLNGSAWIGETFDNSLIRGTDAGFDTKRFDLRASDADGNQIILTFTNVGSLNGDCMDTGDYIAFDDVLSSTQSVYFVTYIDGNSGFSWNATAGSLNIIACNEGNKTISGEFSFDSDYFGYNVGENGVFTNVCYEAF